MQKRCLTGVFKPLEGVDFVLFPRTEKKNPIGTNYSKFQPIMITNIFSCSTGKRGTTQNNEFCLHVFTICSREVWMAILRDFLESDY